MGGFKPGGTHTGGFILPLVKTFLGFLKIDNFQVQKVLHPSWGNCLLDLILIDQDKLFNELNITGCLDATGHNIVTIAMCKQNSVPTRDLYKPGFLEGLVSHTENNYEQT